MRRIGESPEPESWEDQRRERENGEEHEPECAAREKNKTGERKLSGRRTRLHRSSILEDGKREECTDRVICRNLSYGTRKGHGDHLVLRLVLPCPSPLCTHALSTMRISLALTAVLASLSTGYALQVPPDTPLSELISSAKTHLAKGSPRDALVYFDAAVSRDPTNYITLFQRGAAYLSIGKNSLASEDFNRVLELKPNFEGALVQRSRLQARSAHWEGALRDLESAGKKDSVEYNELEEARTAAGLAVAAEKKGDWEACVTQAGVAILKASTDLTLRKTRSHCRLERGEVEEGVSDLAHVLQISPGLVEPHLQMSSMLFYALGDSDRGLAQIRRCLHADPDSKPCNRLYKRERQLSKILGKMNGFLETRKFSNAVKLLVGDGSEEGLIADVKADVAEAREAGHIHAKASNNLYISLVEKTCESYREVGEPFPPVVLLILLVSNLDP